MGKILLILLFFTAVFDKDVASAGKIRCSDLVTSPYADQNRACYINCIFFRQYIGGKCDKDGYCICQRKEQLDQEQFLQVPLGSKCKDLVDLAGKDPRYSFACVTSCAQKFPHSEGYCNAKDDCMCVKVRVEERNKVPLGRKCQTLVDPVVPEADKEHACLINCLLFRHARGECDDQDNCICFDT